MVKRFFIVFLLGFSSGLPLALVSSTLQAWFSEAGMSVLATGMLSLLGLPYVYRFMWAPILDRYSLLPGLGKRRSWIFVMQVLLCVGFNAMAWLSPRTSPMLMVALGFVLASFSATQDATIDAHRTEYLPAGEYGLGASLAIVGYRLALLAAGGLALIIAQYAGWVIAYRSMGCLMFLGMIAILWSPEPSSPLPNYPSFASSCVAPVQNLFSQPEIIPFCFFILFYKLGEAFTTSTSGVVMPFLIQGIGFSLETIAYVNKILGVFAVISGGLIAGLVLLRCSLYRALLVFGLIQALTNALFVLLATVGKDVVIFSCAVVSDNFAAGMGSTALVALFMRFVDRRYTATQFSMLVALATLPRIFSGPIGALIQSWVGWVGLYQISFLLALGFIPFLLMLRQQPYISDPFLSMKKHAHN
ncbi:MAG: MFS transporter [Legionellaceae bacterium]|nr:MFS transporter [Legionellaceae bacterium]